MIRGVNGSKLILNILFWRFRYTSSFFLSFLDSKVKPKTNFQLQRIKISHSWDQGTKNFWKILKTEIRISLNKRIK